MNDLKKPSTLTNQEFEKNIHLLRDIYSEEDLEKIRLLYERQKAKGKVKAKQIRKIVPIRQWVEDEYYIGPFKHNLYNYWKNVIIEIFESPTPINEVILTGATGIGKSTAAVLIIIRKIYELSCYENISSLFPNLSAISRIAFAYLSVTATQARNTGFAGFLNTLDSIPYFKEVFPRKEGIDSQIIWENERLFVTYGSVLNHFIGLDLLGAILDEANYFAGRETSETTVTASNPVYLLYDQVVSRAHSRFVTKNGNDSLSIIASSSTISSSFTESRIKLGLNDPTVYIASPAIWDVRPERYSGERFFVFAGTDLVDPKILDTIEDLNTILTTHNYTTVQHDITIKQAIELIPTDIRAKIIEVPEEHRSAFKSNIVYMLQDLAGFSVNSSNKFFSSKAAFEACIDPTLSHPLTKEEVILSTTKESSQEGYMSLMEYVRPDYEFKNPQVPHYIHLDLSLSGDSTGISMAHISNWQSIHTSMEELEEIDETSSIIGGVGNHTLSMNFRSTGASIVDNELKIPITTVDFMIRINPPVKPNRISYGKIRDFIIWLKFVKKINIAKVTADRFQSAQLLQELEDAGIPTEHLSVDTSPTPYRTLANLIQDGRIRMYEHKVFRQELFGLVETRTAGNKVKIDHPPKLSKDVSDAVCGAVYNAVTAVDKTDTTEQSLLSLTLAANKKDNSVEDATEEAVDNLLKGLLM